MSGCFYIIVSYAAIGHDTRVIHESIPINLLFDCCSEPVSNCDQLKKYAKKHHRKTLHTLVSDNIKKRRKLPPGTKIEIERILLFLKGKSGRPKKL